MAKLYVLFFVTLIIFIITTEFISFRYINRRDMTTLKIDFNIFGITFINDKRIKREKKPRKLPPPSIRTVLSFVKSIISKSSFEINSLNLNFSYKSPTEYVYKRSLYSSLFLIILSFLHSFSKSVQYNSTTEQKEEGVDSELIDVKLSLNLIFLLSSFAGLAFNYAKELFRKNGRKQDE